MALVPSWSVARRRTNTLDALIVCPPGLEALVAGELADLGVGHTRTEKGGVTASLTTRQLYAANRELRCATRVLVRIARFTMPIGQAFSMQAGLTYTILGGAERTVTGTEITGDSEEIASESGGGGEADPPEEPGEGESGGIYGCLDASACNFDAAANVDGGGCDYSSCVGCTYAQAGN